MDLWIEPAIDDGTICYLAGHTFPVAFTKHEGGDWHAIGGAKRIKAPAAVLYQDGSIFDLVLNSQGRHPWRMQEHRPTIRTKAGSLNG